MRLQKRSIFMAFAILLIAIIGRRPLAIMGTRVTRGTRVTSFFTGLRAALKLRVSTPDKDWGGKQGAKFVPGGLTESDLEKGDQPTNADEEFHKADAAAVLTNSTTTIERDDSDDEGTNPDDDREKTEPDQDGIGRNGEFVSDGDTEPGMQVPLLVPPALAYDGEVGDAGVLRTAPQDVVNERFNDRYNGVEEPTLTGMPAGWFKTPVTAEPPLVSAAS